MQHRAREIVGVRRDAGGAVTHVVGRNEDGTRWVLPLDEVLAATASRSASFFITRAGEALLVTLGREAGGLVAATAMHGDVHLSDVQD
jgi:hypothetical protein